MCGSCSRTCKDTPSLQTRRHLLIWQIADPETVPSVVKAARPGAAGRPAVSGKKTTTHCVEFFPEGNLCVHNLIQTSDR
jgi:(2Fe-2S) ferredoxin